MATRRPGRRKGVHRTISFACELCGKSVERTLDRAGRARFCSISCASKATAERRRKEGLPGRTTVACDGCGEPVVKWRHEITHDRLHFHSRACKRLYYARESHDLERLRDVVWDQHQGHCAQCSSIRYTEIHHIDGNHGNNRLENLTLLCKKCHVAAHIVLSGGYLLNGRKSKKYVHHSAPTSSSSA